MRQGIGGHVARAGVSDRHSQVKDGAQIVGDNKSIDVVVRIGRPLVIDHNRGIEMIHCAQICGQGIGHIAQIVRRTHRMVMRRAVERHGPGFSHGHGAGEQNLVLRHPVGADGRLAVGMGVDGQGHGKGRAVFGGHPDQGSDGDGRVIRMGMNRRAQSIPDIGQAFTCPDRMVEHIGIVEGDDPGFVRLDRAAEGDIGFGHGKICRGDHPAADHGQTGGTGSRDGEGHGEPRSRTLDIDGCAVGRGHKTGHRGHGGGQTSGHGGKVIGVCGGCEGRQAIHGERPGFSVGHRAGQRDSGLGKMNRCDGGGKGPGHHGGPGDMVSQPVKSESPVIGHGQHRPGGSGFIAQRAVHQPCQRRSHGLQGVVDVVRVNKIRAVQGQGPDIPRADGTLQGQRCGQIIGAGILLVHTGRIVDSRRVVPHQHGITDGEGVAVPGKIAAALDHRVGRDEIDVSFRIPGDNVRVVEGVPVGAAVDVLDVARPAFDFQHRPGREGEVADRMVLDGHLETVGHAFGQSGDPAPSLVKPVTVVAGQLQVIGAGRIEDLDQVSVVIGAAAAFACGMAVDQTVTGHIQGQFPARFIVEPEQGKPDRLVRPAFIAVIHIDDHPGAGPADGEGVKIRTAVAGARDGDMGQRRGLADVRVAVQAPAGVIDVLGVVDRIVVIGFRHHRETEIRREARHVLPALGHLALAHDHHVGFFRHMNGVVGIEDQNVRGVVVGQGDVQGSDNRIFMGVARRVTVGRPACGQGPDLGQMDVSAEVVGGHRHPVTQEISLTVGTEGGVEQIVARATDAEGVGGVGVGHGDVVMIRMAVDGGDQSGHGLVQRGRGIGNDE
ncbi:hypothetical protein [Desulfatiferula olefinivorans]